MIKLVVFDLDNVVIDGESINEIGKLVNVEDQIVAITEQAMQGELDFKTSLRQRVELLEGASIKDIKALAEKIPLMAGAEETIKSLKENGFDVAIISGGFDVIANTIKEKLNVDNIFTNSLEQENGLLTGEVFGPLVTGSKLDVLSKFIDEAGYTLEECIAVGDGANDISMIESVEYGIAFNAKPALKQIADIIVETRDLTDVLDVILDLNPENTEEGANMEKEVTVEETEVVETTDVVVENQEEQTVEEVEEVVEEEPKTEPKKAKSKKISLPEPDFDLADTMEGVKAQKDEREEIIAKIAYERETFNKKAKEQRKIRDQLNTDLKENLAKAIEFRDQRNEINKEVETNKKLRNKINEEIKNLEWSSGKRDKLKIESEIKKIDKIIETRVLDIKKENRLVKKANALRKQLMEIKEDDKVKKKAAELKKQSEEFHVKVVELSEQAQESHEQMLFYFRKTDEIRTAADEAHRLFIQARKNAAAKHEDFKVVLSEIYVINKKLGTNKSRKRRSEKPSCGSSNKKNREEKEKAESIFDKFKHGKKLSTEELLLLQKYDIN